MSKTLATAVSEYLRQASRDLVQWRPWGEEALHEAQESDKPLFISIGYSSCHWCHVMARESFQDEKTADLLNTRYIPIKVDREEHPEVDKSYMVQASAFTKHLGWPLSIFASSDGVAIYAGSYFPKEAKPQLPAFTSVLNAVLDAWENNRAGVKAQTTELKKIIEQQFSSADREASGDTANGPFGEGFDPEKFLETLEEMEDPQFGGFGESSKFPTIPTLHFLATATEYFGKRVEQDSEAAGIAERSISLLQRSLDAVFTGELWDPIDGAIFRYTVQRNWTEPHYERMLFEQAQFLTVLLKTLKFTDKYVTHAEKVADYLVEHFQQPSGGYASSQDSELPGLGVEATQYYKADADKRRENAAPSFDPKIIASWNGQTIEALTLAGLILRNNSYLASAKKAAQYLIDVHVSEAGPDVAISLFRVSREGKTSAAQADGHDYFNTIMGLARIGAAIGDERFITVSVELLESYAKSFDLKTEEQGGNRVLPIMIREDLPDSSENRLQERFVEMRVLLESFESERIDLALDQIQQHLEWSPLTQADAIQPLTVSSRMDMFMRSKLLSQQVVVIENTQRFPAVKDFGVTDIFMNLTETVAQNLANQGFRIYEAKKLGHFYHCQQGYCELPRTIQEAMEQQLLS